MIVGALECGVALDQFWRLTPRELGWHLRAAMSRALFQERLHRAQKLPSLAQLTGKRERKTYAGDARDFMKLLTAGRPPKEESHG